MYSNVTENRDGSKRYREYKHVVKDFLADINTNDLTLLDTYLEWLFVNYPSLEELLLVKNNTITVVDMVTDLTVTNDEKVPLGYEIMKSLYNMLKAYYRDPNNTPIRFFHDSLKLTLRQYVKENDKSQVKKAYISKITESLVIVFMSYQWNKFLKNEIKAILNS